MDDRLIVEKRLERELWQRVLPHLYAASKPLVVAAWEVPGEPVSYEVACVQEYTDFAVGRAWGRPWGTTWFRLQGDVPTAWPGQQLEAVVDLGFRGSGAGFQAEGLMWVDGEPLQGVHPRRTGVPLAVDAPGPLTLYVEAASNPMRHVTHAQYEAVHARLFEEAVKVVKQKEAAYASSFGIKLSPTNLASEKYDAFYPGELYASYQAFEAGTTYGDYNNRVIQQRAFGPPWQVSI